MRSWPRVRSVLLVVLLVVMINLPLVRGAVTDWRLDRSGVDVRARVVAEAVTSPRDDPAYFLQYRFDRRTDPDQRDWTSRVDRATYERGLAEREIEVRVLPGHPAAHRAAGEVSSHLGLVLTVVADLLLLGVVLLVRRFRARLRPQLRGVAMDDVQPGDGGALLERVEGDLYLVRGRVAAIEGDELVLDLTERTVRVHLDGHHSPVATDASAEVRVRLVG